MGIEILHQPLAYPKHKFHREQTLFENCLSLFWSSHAIIIFALLPFAAYFECLVNLHDKQSVH